MPRGLRLVVPVTLPHVMVRRLELEMSMVDGED